MTMMSVDKSSLGAVLFAWLCMVMAILSGSTIGPMFKYMNSNDIPMLLSASWRCQCMSIFLIPLAFIEYKLSKKESRTGWFAKKPDLPFPVIVHVLMAGLFWSVNLESWVYGLQFTTTVRASVFASSHPLWLIVVLSLLGYKVAALEWCGVIVVIFGLLLCSGKGLLEPSATSTLFGDVMCLAAAMAEVAVLFNRAKTKKYVPLMQYTALTTLCVVCTATFMSVMTESNKLGPIRIFCLHSNCMFGWASSSWVLKMLCFGLTIGVICIAGFNYCVEYISPLIFSSVTLVDPAVTGAIAWLVGIEGCPDMLTIAGGLVVVGGVALISAGERARAEDENREHGAAKPGGNSDVITSSSSSSGIELKRLEDDDETGMSGTSSTFVVNTLFTVSRQVVNTYSKLEDMEEGLDADPISVVEGAGSAD
jgi:drug/metabolite transporter (DMT)-like permease